MRNGRGREVLIHSSAHPQALAHVWTPVYLLNMGAKSSSAQSRGQEAARLCKELRGKGAAPLIYVHETNSKNRKKYMNVVIRGVVDRP